MDDITSNATNRSNGVNQPIGCSTICVNQPDNVSYKFNRFAINYQTLHIVNAFYDYSSHSKCSFFPFLFRKFLHILKMHYEKISITSILCQLILSNRLRKENIKLVLKIFWNMFYWFEQLLGIKIEI